LDVQWAPEKQSQLTRKCEVRGVKFEVPNKANFSHEADPEIGVPGEPIEQTNPIPGPAGVARGPGDGAAGPLYKQSQLGRGSESHYSIIPPFQSGANRAKQTQCWASTSAGLAQKLGGQRESC
jgi:hypothetical protein